MKNIIREDGMRFMQGLRGLAVAAVLAFTPVAHGAKAEVPEVPKVAIHVDQDDPAVMNMALNNAVNIIAHYQALGKEAVVEIVTYGPGLTMLRSDISPVASRVGDLALQHEKLTFSACLNTVESIRQRTNTDVPLLEDAQVVPSGAVRLMELQYEGYAYLKP
jgi:intracellular sulfur oxidation DsrE/DsrF family protein